MSEIELGETVALPMRPYARLLTMLGDQLISSGRIALVELIKNSYDETLASRSGRPKLYIVAAGQRVQISRASAFQSSPSNS